MAGDWPAARPPHPAGAPQPQLGGVEVRINGQAVGLTAVSPERIDAVLPAAAPPGTASLVVVRSGVAGEPEPIEILATTGAPGAPPRYRPWPAVTRC
ncbi:MAG: hypothetical protein R2712_24680 [Vicinamibacterales bacterium]